jgi:RNA polymerase sigma-70 factor (ECF subfamily)
VTFAYLFASLGPDDASASSNRPDVARIRAEDAALVARIREGDEGALETVYRAYHPAMCEVAFRYVRDTDVAEDAVQDVFHRLWERRAGLTVEETLATYLLGAVRHRALNVLRHAGVVRRAAERFIEDEVPALGVAAPATDQQSEAADLEARVLRYLDQLPERTRTLVLLRWKHGLSYAEIAVALGMSAEAAKKLGQRTQGILRPLLEELQDK